MKAVIISLALLGAVCAGAEDFDFAGVLPQASRGAAEGGSAAAGEEKPEGISPYAVGIILAAALGGGGYVCGRKHNVQISPQPLAVEMKKEFVTRADFDRYRASQSDELRHLHGRIDNLTPVVSEIKGNVQRIANTQDTILKLLLKQEP